jgi:hypothetical protein
MLSARVSRARARRASNVWCACFRSTQVRLTSFVSHAENSGPSTFAGW